MKTVIQMWFVSVLVQYSTCLGYQIRFHFSMNVLVFNNYKRSTKPLSKEKESKIKNFPLIISHIEQYETMSRILCLLVILVVSIIIVAMISIDSLCVDESKTVYISGGRMRVCKIMKLSLSESQSMRFIHMANYMVKIALFCFPFIFNW